MWIIGRLLGLFRGAEGSPGQDIPQEAPDLGDIGDACRDWRQGDVFRSARTFVFDSTWQPRPINTPHGAVVVSQTCDACRSERKRIQIAPVVRLEHANDIREAAAGKRPQFVAIPPLGPDYFADLDGITTVAKTALLACDRVCSLETDQNVREFAFSVGRRFGRFAYPDEVVECLTPMKKAIESKARRETSPLGQVLTGVHSFRVQCEDWNAAPYDLTLIVILEPGEVPNDPDEIGDCPNGLAPVADGNLKAQINKYADYLNAQGRIPTERYFGWQFLAEAWARQCEEAAASKDLTRFVGSVTAELATVDDFPLSRFLETESLDLDYLSDSRKPIN